MSLHRGGLFVAALTILAVIISGCGKSNDDAAKETALHFFHAMANGESAECDEATADDLRLCEGRATRRPAFKAAEITSVHTSSEVLGAPASPFGTVSARVLGGQVRLRLEKSSYADWRVEQVVTHFGGRYAAANLRRP
jgi:hypothetical protein